MSDKAEKKPAEPAKEGDAHGAKKAAGGGIMGLLTKLPVMLGGVMIIEAAVLFAGFKFLGSGNPNAVAGADLTKEHASAEEGHGEAAAEGGHGEGADGAPVKVDPKKQVELLVVEFRAPNKQSGRTFIYDVSIYLMTRGQRVEKTKSAIKDREAQIKDRIRTIIAQSDPDKLGGGSEPGLETLRRQVKYQLDELLGEGVVEEVIIPRCIPFRADF